MTSKRSTTKVRLRPLQDRILIRRLEAEEKSPGGIIIPDNAKEKPVQGEVLAVGGGRILDNGERSPVGCEPGDVVLFSKYGGTEVTLDGEDYLIVRADDVHGVLDKM